MFDFDLPAAQGTLAVDACQTSPTTGPGGIASPIDLQQHASVTIAPDDGPRPPDPR